jgi:hypothetical protein
MEKRTLLQVPVQFRSFQATNPRDHIYGVLGLISSKSSEVIIPHYALDVEKIFTSTAATMLQSTTNLDCLGPRKARNLPRLPSWVPDWTVTEEYQMLGELEGLELTRYLSASKIKLKNNAAGSSISNPRFRDNGTLLGLDGLILDEIAEVGIALDEQRFKQDGGDSTSVMLNW